MGRRASIPDYIKFRVAAIYEELYNERGHLPPAWEVHQRLIDEQGKRRYPVPLPEKRTVQLIGTQVREYLKQKKEVDRAWSLGESARQNIPTDANEDLLKIWKWCIIVGRTFTVREAWWAAQLRGIVPFEFLLPTAYAYSVRERACESLKQPFDTSDMDAELAFKPPEEYTRWPYLTAQYVGAIRADAPPLISQYESRECGAEIPLTAMLLRPSQAVEAYLDLEESAKLPENANTVYSMLLREFSRGLRWQWMSKEAKQGIAKRLHEEVTAASKEMDDLWQAYLKSYLPEDLRQAAGKVIEWEPSQELLKDVGLVRTPVER